MTTPTHDLAIARAERDAWQSTCEELHRAIAGANVEIEAHLGRCEAADQRARSLDAALAAEREANKGLVAQVDGWRDTWARVETIVDEAFGPSPVSPVADTLKAMERGILDGILAAQELAAIRDLVAPGNPQGTVVDAVRAMMAMDARYRDTADEDACAAIDRAEKAEAERDAAIARAEKAERPCNGSCDIALASRQIGPDGIVPGNARECAELWEREASRLEMERRAAVECAEKVERERENWVGQARSVSAQLKDVMANLATADRDNATLRARAEKAEGLRDFHKRGEVAAEAERDTLRARVAELEARPVLTVEQLAEALDAHGHAALARKVFAHLGPVTLPVPAQDRAEELARAIDRAAEEGSTIWSDATRRDRAEITRAALASLGAPWEVRQ